MHPCLSELLTQVRACRICEADLPLGPRPVLRVHSDARILIAGQAPGLKVHTTGTPFDRDASSWRLCEWLGLTQQALHDPVRMAFLPMGFCYPGRGKSGDRPPRPECQHQPNCCRPSRRPWLRFDLAIHPCGISW